MSDADDPIPLDEAAVPSHGTLFDDPDSSPPVVSPRLANTDRGRLYRSAHAVGPLADAAIVALTRPSDVDPELPQSPEIVAVEQAAAAAAQREADERARAADEAARAAQAAALAAAEAAALAERARAEANAPLSDVAAEPAAAASGVDAPATPVPPSTPVVVTPPTEGPVTDAAVAAALGLLPPPGAAPASQPVVAPVGAPVVSAPVASPDPAVAALVPATAAAAEPALTPAAVLPTGRRAVPQLTWTQSAVLITGVTIVFGLIDVISRHSIGTLTGIGLVLSTIAAALLVQRDDIWVAVVVPPLAFFAALVTAGQLAVGGTGSFISRQALNIVTGLSINAPWILGATAIGLVIVLVRRRRSPGARAESPSADLTSATSA